LFRQAPETNIGSRAGKLYSILKSLRFDSKRSKLSLVLVCLAAWILTAPWIGGSILQYRDLSYPRLPLETYPGADAIAILSGDGAPRQTRSPGEPLSRSETGLSLYWMGKARHLVVTNGGIEGQQSRDEAVRQGVPAARIFIAQPAHNTSDEAREISRIAEENGWHRLILVTSGYHMARAEGLLEYFAARDRWSLQVIPCASDSGKLFLNLDSSRRFVPSIDGVLLTMRAGKESIGSAALSLASKLRFWMPGHAFR
jgi:uncharacterized SAM-binding protein YcdF (DUF218 family)